MNAFYDILFLATKRANWSKELILSLNSPNSLAWSTCFVLISLYSSVFSIRRCHKKQKHINSLRQLVLVRFTTEWERPLGRCLYDHFQMFYLRHVCRRPRVWYAYEGQQDSGESLWRGRAVHEFGIFKSFSLTSTQRSTVSPPKGYHNCHPCWLTDCRERRKLRLHVRFW